MFGMELGIIGLIWLVLVIWAIVHVAESRAEPGAKAIWIVVLIVFPILGVLVWALAGPRKGR